MNWTQYKKLLDVKIADAHYVLSYTEKKYKEAKAQYESVLREKESFKDALEDLLERGSNDDSEIPSD